MGNSDILGSGLLFEGASIRDFAVNLVPESNGVRLRLGFKVDRHAERNADLVCPSISFPQRDRGLVLKPIAFHSKCTF